MEDAEDGERRLRLRIRTSRGRQFDVSVSLSRTVREFKEQISRQAEVSADDQRLIYQGRLMKDELQLSHYELVADTTVHLVLAVRPAASAPAAVAARPSAAVGAQPFGGFPPPPLGGGLDSMSEMERRLMSDPEAMASLMNSPLTQSLLSNPETLRSIIDSDPRLRGVFEQNPQLRHALSDPNVLREAFEAASSPARLREAMRHQDLALSQLENHPEGFNALRRMYEDVQSPLLDSIDDMALSNNNPSSSSSGNAANQPSSATNRHQLPGNAPSGALANPWAARQPSPRQSLPFGPATGARGGNGFPPQAAGFPFTGFPPAAAAGGGFPNMGQPGPGGGVPRLDPNLLMQLLGGSGGFGRPSETSSRPPGPRSPPVIPPNPWAHIVDGEASQEEPQPTSSPSWESQHHQLVEMGFQDRVANERALVSTRRICFVT